MPLLKDLYEVCQSYAAHWKEIGLLLGLCRGELNNIEQDKVYRVEQCCLAMLDKWLDVDPDASWPKLFKIIDQILISGENIEAGISTYKYLTISLYMIWLCTCIATEIFVVCYFHLFRG